jgi:hypothetical protein
MKAERNIEADVRASLHNEWPNLPIFGLRSYAFEIDNSKKRVLLTAIFNRPISAEDKEQFWVIEGILATHLDDEWVVSTEFSHAGDERTPRMGQIIWFPFNG